MTEVWEMDGVYTCTSYIHTYSRVHDENMGNGLN